jgi:sigma-E factor negative regulatory protein RseC
MDSPVGKIVSIVDGKATVEVERQAACPRCAAGKGCGAGLLSGSTRPALLEVSVSAHQHFSEGDEVTLSLEPSHLTHAAMLVYGLPLAGTVLMLIVGWSIMRPLSDLVAIAFAAAGLAAGFLTGRWLLDRRLCLRKFVPRIVGPVTDAAS